MSVSSAKDPSRSKQRAVSQPQGGGGPSGERLTSARLQQLNTYYSSSGRVTANGPASVHNYNDSVYGYTARKRKQAASNASKNQQHHSSSQQQPLHRPHTEHSAADKKSRTGHSTRRGADTVSEGGLTVLSAFHYQAQSRKEDKVRAKQTDSPARRWVKWMNKTGKSRYTIPLLVLFVTWIKFAVGLGPYSGKGKPPLRGDFEAQRHWIALTSSSIQSPRLYSPPSSLTIPPSRWYFHDLEYWGLDYPPLTAYHSLAMGYIAKLSPATARFVTLRPPSDAPAESLKAWERQISSLESDGQMKSWMRWTVIVSDLVWISAVLRFVQVNFARRARAIKGHQPAAVAALSILLQPALLLIDHGHFQYNSVMLGFTLWAVNFFQANHDLLGAIAFVFALCFKQMALYYAPAVFAYLLGKCLIINGRRGFSHLLNIGLVTSATFALLFLPFLTPKQLAQSLHRIFPFARGLFEDKVANFWCTLNLVVKLRQQFSISTLARLSLLVTLLAVLPGMLGVLYISREIGKRRSSAEAHPRDGRAAPVEGGAADDDGDDAPNPTHILLPHSLFTSAMAFFLFSFQVHEKSILLPLMPITVLLGGREAGFGRLDWEWSVLVNNVAVFSMWPLLKRDGLGLQYVVLTLLWNYVIGYNPISLRPSFVKFLSLSVYAVMLAIHGIELVASPPAHLPDLFVMMNQVASAGVFGLAYLWATKRSAQEGWVVVGSLGESEASKQARRRDQEYRRRRETSVASSRVSKR